MKNKRAGLTNSVLAPANGQIKPLESFTANVQAAIDDHCSVNQIWSWLASVAPTFETEHYLIADEKMERAGILRDVSSVDWSIGCLSRLCADVAIPVSGLDHSVAHGPEPDEMTGSWLIVRKDYPEAAGLMMQGKLGTGIQMVMATDPKAVFDLTNIVAFHALDSAYRAARDAQLRLRDPLQLYIHALATNKVPRNGALAHSLREAWTRASEVHTIFRNSGPIASQEDSEWVGALGLNDRAVAQRHGMAPSDPELIGLLAVLLKEGQAGTDHLVQSLDGR